MSNSVRSLGSGRGADAAIRPGALRPADSGGADPDFAAAVSLAIGAAAGAVATQGDGADAENGTSQDAPALTMPAPTVSPPGKVTDLLADTATVTAPIIGTANPGTMPVPATGRMATPTGGLGVAKPPLPLARADLATPLPSVAASLPSAGAALAAPSSPVVASLSVDTEVNLGPAAPLLSPATPPLPSPRVAKTLPLADAVAAVSPRGTRHGTRDVSARTSSPDATNIPIGGVTLPTPSSASPIVPPQPEAVTPTAANDDLVTPSLVPAAGTILPRGAITDATSDNAQPIWPARGIPGPVTPLAAIASPVTATAPTQTTDATDLSAPSNRAVVTPSLVPPDRGSSAPTNAAVSPLPATPVAFDRFGWRIRLDNSASSSASSSDPVIPTAAPASTVVTDRSPAAPPSVSAPIQMQTEAPPQTQIQIQSQDQSPVAAQPDVAPPLPPQPPSETQGQSPTLVSAVIAGVVPFNNVGDARAPKADTVDAVVGAAPVSAPGPAPAAVSASTGGAATATFGAPAGFGDTLANHVMSMISSGRQEATMQLQPPQLGELTVRVSVQGRDVSTWFGAAQPQVQVAVSQALDQLRGDLAGAGLSLAGAWVGADSSTMQQRMFDTGATPSRRSNFTVSSVDGAPIDNTDSSRRSSGVSIYV